jgi:hypothetical protein
MNDKVIDQILDNGDRLHGRNGYPEPTIEVECPVKDCHWGTIMEGMGTKILEPFPCPKCKGTGKIQVTTTNQ